MFTVEGVVPNRWYVWVREVHAYVDMVHGKKGKKWCVSTYELHSNRMVPIYNVVCLFGAFD